MSPGVLRETAEGGSLWRFRLAAPKANVLDQSVLEALTGWFREAAHEKGLKAVLLEAEGPHFSFGASVTEHLPGRYETMIPTFHRLFDTMLDADVVTLAAVQGLCLGGGLELASFCHRVVAHPGAFFGQPEIQLGVFAPVASAFLVERVGRGAAEDLCLSGRQVGAEEAHRWGLVDELADDPVDAALEYVRRHLLPHSASSLRLAVRAVRGGLASRFREELARVERLYVEELMATHDAVEGLEAFVDKRDPAWRNQ